MSDAELLERVGRQDHEALAAIYDRYSRLVYSIGRNVLQNDGEAEEMTQDVFLTVWRRAVSYEPTRGKVSTWLGSIAHHRAIDIIRRRRRDQDAFDRAAAEATRTAATVDGVDSAAERSWERDRLLSALEGVPTEQRQVLMLAYFHGLTHTEIARTLNQPLGTVKTRIRLAVRKLRDALEGEFGTGD